MAELERNLELEPPRANVDLRNTLQAPPSKGVKKKKSIPYEVSELRGIEVLEGLCPGMDQYGILKEEDGFVSFQRYNAKGAGSVKIMGSMTLGSDQFQDDRKKLQVSPPKGCSLLHTISLTHHSPAVVLRRPR